MTYEEARHFMEGPKNRQIHLALDRIAELLRRLGDPQDQVPCVHIAGTNGKGSILAYISTALTEAGYKTGRFSSPAVYEYREQFQIDGVDIPEETYAALAGEIEEKVRQMEADGWIRPSAFELETSLAFLYFARSGCDFNVIECGMGGRDDATNVIRQPAAAVFASISKDHSAFLGDTTDRIARVKAGIMRPGAAVITSYQEPIVMKVLKEEAERLGAPFIYADLERTSQPVIGQNTDRLSYRYQPAKGDSVDITVQLPGLCQVQNSLTAWETLQYLKQNWDKFGKGKCALTDKGIQKALFDTVWPGRFTKVASDPDFLVDGAHNPGAALELRRSIERYYPGKRLIFIIGMFRDKDHDRVAGILASMAAAILTVQTPDNPRALPAEELAETVRKYNPHVKACQSLDDAVKCARELAGPNDVILSFGSLSNIAAITCLASGLQQDRGEE